MVMLTSSCYFSLSISTEFLIIDSFHRRWDVLLYNTSSWITRHWHLEFLSFVVQLLKYYVALQELDIHVFLLYRTLNFHMESNILSVGELVEFRKMIQVQLTARRIVKCMWLVFMVLFHIKPCLRRFTSALSSEWNFFLCNEYNGLYMYMYIQIYVASWTGVIKRWMSCHFD